MTMQKTCRALVAVLGLALLMALASTGSASADFRYCSQPVPSRTVCPANSGVGDFIDNVAQYAGQWSGSVRVCERTMSAYTGTQFSRYCAFDYAWSGAAWSYSGEYLLAGNDSPWTHTIYGDAGTPSAARSAEPTGGRLVDRATLPAGARAELGVLRSAGSKAVTTIARPDDQVTVTATSENLVCVRSTLTDGGACQTPENAASGGLIGVSICGGEKPDATLGIYGMVPDAVSAVEIRDTAGGVLRHAAVVGNTFRLDLPKADVGRANDLRWVGAEGGRTLAEILPSDLGC